MAREKTIYFIRHGESQDNALPVFQAPDSPLSELGVRQAKNIAQRISKIPFDVLISSPFMRAKQTAEIIARVKGEEIEFSDLFVERIKPSEIDGKAHKDKKAAAIWKDWNRSLYASGLRVADGENFDDIIVRADKALEYLEKRNEQSIVVVTHGYFLRAIIGRVLLNESLTGETFKKIQHNTSTENTGISVIKYMSGLKKEAHWHLWIYNDHSHLG